MGHKIKTIEKTATSYNWPTTIIVSPSGLVQNYWVYHNGTIYSTSSVNIPATSGVPDDWSVALVDVNGKLWTTGTNDGKNSPNDNTALTITITMNGAESNVLFQWTDGFNFTMSLYQWPEKVI